MFTAMPIATVLSVSFGTLVVVAILTVLGISLVSGFRNTNDLLNDKATAAMDAARGDLIDLLDPAEEQVRYVTELIHSGVIDIDNESELDDFLLGGIAGTPQIDSLTFVTPNFNIIAANRHTKSVVRLNAEKDPIVVSTVQQVFESQSGSWGPLTYVPQLGETMLNFRQPIAKDGKIVGVLIATIPVSAVNEKLKSTPISKAGTRFVLYGNDDVLLQQNDLSDAKNIMREGVVPKLSEIDDPVLKEIWSPSRNPLELLGDDVEYSGHHINLEGTGYLYFYSTLEGFSDKKLIVGYWIPEQEAVTELKRLALAGFAGLAIMLLSVLIAFYLGRKISRPILALSHASQQISKLEFEDVEALPASRFKEVSEANEAYNTMVRGLIWFETYVPKSLVRKLINTGEAKSEQRTVTVMFTDIVGFTPQAEGMSSTEVADFLNHHFRLVTSCIEAEGGTVDKFIGDAVMAFWGAPEIQEDHAARACRTALAIKQSIEADNEDRQSAGLSPVRMRIGIHTGSLVVGNIGSKGRINYTVVGDTVNIAQRMEQLGKSVEVDIPSDVFTLITDATYSAVSTDISAEEVGDRNVKGRTDAVRIYRLT